MAIISCKWAASMKRRQPLGNYAKELISGVVLLELEVGVGWKLSGE